MQPVAFLRKAWKKWEKKRADKRNVRASTFHYIPSPRRSRSWTYQRASNTSRRTALPKPERISYEDYTNSILASHKWITIKRRKSSTIKESTSYCGEQVSSLCYKPRRESQPASPLTCFTIPPGSKYASYGKQADRASDFHPHRGRNSRIPSTLPSLRLLPPTDMNYDQDGLYNLAASRSERSSLSSRSSPNTPYLSIAEKSSSVRGQTARVTSRRTRLTTPAEPPDSPKIGYLTDRLHPKIVESSSSKGYGSRTSAPPPKISISTTQTSDVHDFPLSLFPQPPPLLVRRKVPKPLSLKPSRPSSPSSHSLLPYSPLGSPVSLRPRSLRSVSQASFASSKRGRGRPLASVSPPPTSPPNSPLPDPPLDKRMDSNLLSPSAYSASVKGSIRSCETLTQQVYRRSAEYSS